MASLVAQMAKESACNAGDVGWICGLNPWVGKIPCRKEGYPLQCSCLENPRDEGAWWAAVYGVAQSRTLLRVGHDLGTKQQQQLATSTYPLAQFALSFPAVTLHVVSQSFQVTRLPLYYLCTSIHATP